MSSFLGEKWTKKCLDFWTNHWNILCHHFWAKNEDFKKNVKISEKSVNFWKNTVQKYVITFGTKIKISEKVKQILKKTLY